MEGFYIQNHLVGAHVADLGQQLISVRGMGGGDENQNNVQQAPL